MQAYIKIDQQLHLLSQILAKANRTFLPKKDDDSHTNLYFDPLGKRILGRWITITSEKVILSLNLNNLEFELLNAKAEIVFSIPSIGKTMVTIGHELEESFAGINLNAGGLSEPLHFEIPDYDFAKNSTENLDPNGLQQWIYYRDVANKACYDLLGNSQVDGEVRIWPHHFDTGIYFEPKDNIGIGFGLAMKDNLAGAPYFYMSGYALKGSLNYQSLPTNKTWKWEISEHWKGVILPLTNLENISADMHSYTLNDYLNKNIQWFFRQ